jgi:hypothetical protein
VSPKRRPKNPDAAYFIVDLAQKNLKGIPAAAAKIALL